MMLADGTASRGQLGDLVHVRYLCWKWIATCGLAWSNTASTAADSSATVRNG
ncbi:MAG: hypothetical protein M3Z75_12125 [Actinomycetota bacterium]|nr:hypothetical protein [Actinomycetota bacterium]